MKTKNYIALFLAAFMLLFCVSCGKEPEPTTVIEPDEGRLKSICQLSVLEGYFHNVVKYKKTNPSKFFLKRNDTNFWVEYTGIAKYGVDASKVTLEISGNEITITIPKAHMLYCKVDSTSLDENSYIVAKDSFKVTSEDSKTALVQAQDELQKQAANYDALLSLAQQRAQELMEDYVKNIMTMSGKDETSYKINWVYLDEE